MLRLSVGDENRINGFPFGVGELHKAAFPRQKPCAGFLTLNTLRLLERLGSLARIPFGDEPGAETPVFMGLFDRYISALGADFGARHPPAEGPWGLADFA